MHWKPIETAPPGQLIFVRGSSGYTTHERFYVAAYRDDNFRPPLDDGSARWLLPNNEPLIDYGWEPTEWDYLPE